MPLTELEKLAKAADQMVAASTELAANMSQLTKTTIKVAELVQGRNKPTDYVPHADDLLTEYVTIDDAA